MANDRPTNSTPFEVLTINGGSSSIKFALFETGKSLRRILSGKIDGIGLARGSFVLKETPSAEHSSQTMSIPNQTDAINLLMEWARKRFEGERLAAVGHRIVHGGPKYWEAQRITTEMIQELRQLSPFDPEHLPEEIQLAEAFHRQLPELPQIACFDTEFHHDMPRLAQLLAIPRRYEAKGVRRYGFHGLSCAYLLEELARVAGSNVARGRVVLAHLGNGASITAVRDGKSIDTSMAFTPTAGLPMGTRSGDLDPGICGYLSQVEQMTAKQFNQMINHESGLLGISETSSDVRDLLSREMEDHRAAEAIGLFCYQTKKWICAFAGALEGLETLVFAGGIGENAPEIRARICRGLEFLGIKIESHRNNLGAPVISSDGSPVTVRVIRTDEESIIAKSTCRILKIAA